MGESSNQSDFSTPTSTSIVSASVSAASRLEVGRTDVDPSASPAVVDSSTCAGGVAGTGVGGAGNGDVGGFSGDLGGNCLLEVLPAVPGRLVLGLLGRELLGIANVRGDFDKAEDIGNVVKTGGGWGGRISVVGVVTMVGGGGGGGSRFGGAVGGDVRRDEGGDGVDEPFSSGGCFTFGPT